MVAHLVSTLLICFAVNLLMLTDNDNRITG